MSIPTTRLGDNNPLGKSIQRLFSAENLHEAMRTFDSGVRGLGLTPTEVAIRWISHHSALAADDGVILGASRPAQIVETVAFIRKGPLPPRRAETSGRDLGMRSRKLGARLSDGRPGLSICCALRRALLLDS